MNYRDTRRILQAFTRLIGLLAAEGAVTGPHLDAVLDTKLRYARERYAVILPPGPRHGHRR